MNALIHMLTKSGLLTKDLDYHLIRASMVDCLPGLWLPEMVRVRGTGPDPLYQQRPADFLDVPCFRHPRGQLVSGRFRMAVRCAAVPGILEQATGNLGSHWVDCHVRDDGHDHPVHAKWLGSGCRISGDGRQRSLPDEGCRPLGGVDLLAETRCRASA